MKVIIHPHAAERQVERGVSVQEITATVEQGERFEAKYDRVGFKRNFPFDGLWRGKHYANKQAEAYAVKKMETGW